MSKRTKFRIVLPEFSGGGGATVEVDGKDITDSVRSLTVTAGVSDVTRVVLEFAGTETQIDGIGEIIGVVGLTTEEEE